MSEQIKQTYDGIEIVYDENRNVWVYTLRGRERSSESLAKAKEIIDKPEPKDKKPFERVTCWYVRYQQEILPVEVTSIAESPSWTDRQQVWISYPDGKSKRREKTYLESVFPQTPANNELVARCQELDSQINKLTDELSKTKSKLKPLEL